MTDPSQTTPPATPLDIRQGHTKADDVAFPLRWGILGAGAISAQWVGCLHQCPGAKITAVAARELERAQAFATRLDISRAYGSYRELVAAEDVDIVYVGTITRLHKEHTLLAIEAGKHVLCEKALAENVEDARAMHDAAKAAGVMLQDAMWTRFFPVVEHARAAIEAGAIGEPVLVQSDFFDPIYTIQAAPLAFGADAVATKVLASGRRGGAAIVEYGGDGGEGGEGSVAKRAVFTFPSFPSELAEVTEIVGTQGRITLHQPGHCPTALSIHRSPPDGAPSRYRTRNRPAPVEYVDYPLPGTVGLPTAYPNQHGFLYQAEAVHRCLAAGLRSCPQYDEAESLHCMDLYTRINRARFA